MIPGLDRISPSIARFFRAGGYSADLGTGMVPTLQAIDLSKGPTPPFTPFMGGFNQPATAASFSYAYIGLNANLFGSKRLVIDRIEVTASDATIKFGIEVMQVGLLRVFTVDNPVDLMNSDASGVELNPAAGATLPSLRLPIYCHVGADATDLWTTAASNRVLTGVTPGINRFDVQIILKPGVFFFLQSNVVNSGMNATFYGRLFD